MTDFSNLSEDELLAIWNKDNFGLKGQLYKLEQEYICVDGLITRIERIKQQLNKCE